MGILRVQRGSILSTSNPAAFYEYLLGLNPLSMWALDEVSGTNANDQGSLGNDGTYTTSPTLGQASLLPSGYGKSTYFNGTLSAGSRPYVAIPTNAGYDTGTFTLVALVKFATVITSGTVVNWRDAGNNDGWTIEPSGATTLTFYCWDTAFRNCAQTIAAATPYLMVARCDGTNIKLALTNLTTGATAAEASALCGNMTAPGTTPVVRIGMAAQTSPASAPAINGNVQLVTWIGSAITDAQVAEIQRLATA